MESLLCQDRRRVCRVAKWRDREKCWFPESRRWFQCIATGAARKGERLVIVGTVLVIQEACLSMARSNALGTSIATKRLAA